MTFTFPPLGDADDIQARAHRAMIRRASSGYTWKRGSGQFNTLRPMVPGIRHRECQHIASHVHAKPWTKCGKSVAQGSYCARHYRACHMSGGGR
jgi:hypothetical protein